MMRRSRYLAAALALLALGSGVAFARAGALDPAFGSGGVVLTQVRPAGSSSFLSALVRGPDSKVVAGGRTAVGRRSLLALVRYQGNGRLDTSFGSRGKVFTDLSGRGAVQDLVRLSNGRLVALARYGGDHPGPPGYESGFALVRYPPDGRVDRSFGRRGVVTRGFRFPGNPVAVVRKHDNRLIVLFAPLKYSTEGRTLGAGIMLLQFRADGRLDRSFGGDGIVRTTRIRMGPGALALQRDGKVVVAGSSGRQPPENGLLLARYLPSGRLDTRFGAGGLRTASLGLVNPTAAALAISSTTGDLIVAGAAQRAAGEDGGMLVADFRSDGRPRTSFGDGGATVVDFTRGYDYAVALVRQPDAKLVVAGTTIDYSAARPVHPALARLLPDGRLDSTFGDGGRVVPEPFTSGENSFTDLVRQPNGRLVAGGVAGIFRSAGSTAADARFMLLGFRDR